MPKKIYYEVWVDRSDGTCVIAGDKTDDPAVVGVIVNYALRTWKDCTGVTVVKREILDKK